ncbi:protease/lipase ABC transporter permease/ATP-binding protein [Rhodobacteraceae bacterium (ex Bugula neritina AB1)]|nr:protease/lipase ABC transporter permease/ATP-binding protein [Rhodobacteraceae bacterium (ex Bugula neritina AB1)]
MARTPPQKPGLEEIRAARRAVRSLFWLVGLFSFFVNLLMLIGPVYMIQVYDRVLGSRSMETLVALTVLVGFLYLIMAVLDVIRSRILVRAGARFHEKLEERVFTAVQDKVAAGFHDESAATGLRDLEAMRKALSSPIVSACFDLPWTPLFLLLIAFFHPYLGAVALLGGLVLGVFALANQFSSRKAVAKAATMGATAQQLADGMRRNAELIQGLGMRRSAFGKWVMMQRMAISSELYASDKTGGFSSATRAFRLALQSAMLGTGAYLVLDNALTPGVMIAASVIMGRALSPIETLIGQWPLVQRALQAQDRLGGLLEETPERPEPMPLARPKAKLEVQAVTLVPPAVPGQVSKPVLQGLNFTLQPGQALGVIGSSGAGKSSLARALIGVWHPAAGKIRLDGASLVQYGMEDLGRYMGYLPQQVALFDGTIGENIARLEQFPDPDKIVAAARKAAVHEMILQLPQGYDTPVQIASSRLSGGQVQRIGLARALYGDPLLLVLDEPNSNLDNDGSLALNQAVAEARQDGRTVVIMAHRPAAIQLCDMILILDQGVQRAFGPKEQVLREHLQNPQVVRAAPGGPPQQGSPQDKQAAAAAPGVSGKAG